MGFLECVLCLAIAPYWSSYDATIVSEHGIQVELAQPAYLWASYEQPSLKRLGQNIGDLDLPGAGAGYRFDLSPSVQFGVQVGIYWPGNDWNPAIRDEVVGGLLANDHGRQDWYPKALYRDYRLKSSAGGSLHLLGKITKRFSAWGGYRFLSLPESYDLYTNPDGCFESKKCHQNRTTLSADAWRVGLRYVIGGKL